MSRKGNPAALGVFVVIAMILVVVLIVVFGSVDFMSKQATVVMYFDESVGGLDIGAPVEFQGVLVGNVIDIYMLSSKENPIGQIPVIARLQPKKTKRIGAEEKADMDQLVKQLVEMGLRAKLTSQSMVTGKLKIVLDMQPETDAVYRNEYLKFIEIPTVYSPIASVTRELKDMPFQDIVNNVNDAVQSISALAQSEDLTQTLFEARTTLAGTSKVMDNLNAGLPIIMNNINTLMVEVQHIVEENSSMRTEFSQMSDELTDMARSVRYLADYLERHPEALLKGKGE